MTNAGSYAYDAASRLKTAGGVSNDYDGDGNRVKHANGSGTIFYLWSSVMGEPVAEVTSGGVYRAYVYGPGGGQMMAMQSYDGQFYWTHTDHLGSGRKLTNASGDVVYRGEFDPHGQSLYEWHATGQTYLNSHKFTGYERDWATNLDHAKARTYHHNRGRFMQPDPMGLEAADLTNPQSLNRYSYVHNDPVNFTDPLGLYEACAHEAMTKFLAKLAGFSEDVATKLGQFAGDGPGGADSREFAATSFKNIVKSLFGKGPSVNIHFASEQRLVRMKASFQFHVDSGNFQKAGFALHAVEDVHGAHLGLTAIKHAIAGHKPDRIIGDQKFRNVANEVFQVLSGNSTVTLTASQISDLVNAIIARCGQEKKPPPLEVTRPRTVAGGGGGGGGGGGYAGYGGGYPSWWYSMWEFLRWVNSIPVGQPEDEDNGHLA